MARKALTWLDRLLFIPRPEGLSTTRSTKPYRNVALELQVRAILRERELLHHRIAMRSGTLARWER